MKQHQNYINTLKFENAAKLRDKENELHNLAQALLDYETIDSKQLPKVLKGESLDSSGKDHFVTNNSTQKRKRRTTN